MQNDYILNTIKQLIQNLVLQIRGKSSLEDMKKLLDESACNELDFAINQPEMMLFLSNLSLSSQPDKKLVLCFRLYFKDKEKYNKMYNEIFNTIKKQDLDDNLLELWDHFNELIS